MAEKEKNPSRWRRVRHATKETVFRALGLRDASIVFDFTEDGRYVPAPVGEPVRELVISASEDSSTLPPSNEEETIPAAEPEQEPVRKISFDDDPLSIASEVLGVPIESIQKLPATIVTEHVSFNPVAPVPPQGEIATLIGAPLAGIGVQVQDYLGIITPDETEKPQVVAARTVTAFIPDGSDGASIQVREVGTTGFVSPQKHPIFFTFSPAAETSLSTLSRS